MQTTLSRQLADAVKQWSLLENPFYVAWSAGTLSLDALQLYASEYAQFLELLPQGWSTLSDAKTAEEETEHAEIWQEFAQSVQTKITKARLPQTQNLVKLAKKLFSTPATA